MSKLTIYNEQKTLLSPISFINDLQNQVKIRDLDSSSDSFFSQISALFTKTSNLLGIKTAITPINGQDIVDCILMKYKGLSINELEYAFKLERYGEFGKRVEHYQLFNAEYVSSVIDRYLEWKQFKINTLAKKEKMDQKISEEEIRKKDNQSILRYLNEYEFTRVVNDMDFHIYRHLDKLGLVNYSLEFKKQIKEKAITLVYEEENKRVATSLTEKREINSSLTKILNGTSGLVRCKCEVLALEHFLNEIYTTNEKVKQFKENFI